MVNKKGVAKKETDEVRGGGNPVKYAKKEAGHEVIGNLRLRAQRKAAEMERIRCATQIEKEKERTTNKEGVRLDWGW